MGYFVYLQCRRKEIYLYLQLIGLHQRCWSKISKCIMRVDCDHISKMKQLNDFELIQIKKVVLIEWMEIQTKSVQFLSCLIVSVVLNGMY